MPTEQEIPNKMKNYNKNIYYSFIKSITEWQNKKT